MRTKVWFLGSLSGLRIWSCRELWCKLQMQLRSGITVAVVWPAPEAPIWPPSPGTSICCRYGPKKAKNKQKKRIHFFVLWACICLYTRTWIYISVHRLTNNIIFSFQMRAVLNLTCFFFFCFLRPHSWHMEVPRLGVKLELQPHHSHSNATYTTAHGNARSLTH